jgi:hypothetical protein
LGFRHLQAKVIKCSVNIFLRDATAMYAAPGWAQHIKRDPSQAKPSEQQLRLLTSHSTLNVVNDPKGDITTLG